MFPSAGSRWFLVGLLIAALAAGPATLHARTKVSVDYDKKADFSKVRTYAWKEGTPADDRLIEQKIHMSIDEQLKTKGLKQVETDPDVYVVTHVSTAADTKIDQQTFGYGGWYGWDGWVLWGPASSVQMRDVVKGMLVVDILGGGSKLLIWRGVATSTLPEMPDPNRVAKKIVVVAEKMFQEFPPPAGGKK